MRGGLESYKHVGPAEPGDVVEDSPCRPIVLDRFATRLVWVTRLPAAVKALFPLLVFFG